MYTPWTPMLGDKSSNDRCALRQKLVNEQHLNNRHAQEVAMQLGMNIDELLGQLSQVNQIDERPGLTQEIASLIAEQARLPLN
ncbi:hypothetical protein [Shewanella marisflavi]|uniref:hypothetical protein n=1 Tax=Shewanella marisflavi TaxID=260364 RepID=UPI003AAE3CB8